MTPISKPIGAQVIQILGGVGIPTAESRAVYIVSRLAMLVQGQSILLPVPAIVSGLDTRQLYLQDPFVCEAIGRFDSVTLALVGIGSVEPSDLLASSGNVFSPQELESFRELGAVGDVCLRFFDVSWRAGHHPSQRSGDRHGARAASRGETLGRDSRGSTQGRGHPGRCARRIY